MYGADAFAVTVWVAAPPSDHEANAVGRAAELCGDCARDRVRRAFDDRTGERSRLGVELPTVNWRPDGGDWKASTDSSRVQRSRGLVRQAARIRHRKAELEMRWMLMVGRCRTIPRSHPTTSESGARGSPGQEPCRSTSCQTNADGGSVPCCWSDADPEKPIVSPTRHVVPAVGVAIVATGGVLFAVMETVALVEVAPMGSVTRRRAGDVPGCE